MNLGSDSYLTTSETLLQDIYECNPRVAIGAVCAELVTARKALKVEQTPEFAAADLALAAVEGWLVGQKDSPSCAELGDVLARVLPVIFRGEPSDKAGLARYDYTWACSLLASATDPAYPDDTIGHLASAAANAVTISVVLGTKASEAEAAQLGRLSKVLKRLQSQPFAGNRSRTSTLAE